MLMNYKNLEIIGTSHIARQSLDDVKKAIEERTPDIIALELDLKRYMALISKNKKGPGLRAVFNVGIKGYLFSLIGAWAERKLGEIVKVEPGSEMKLAIKLAKKNKIKIAFIDQDIEITLKKFSKSLTWKEKWNFVVDIFKGVILRKREVDFDLTTVPEQKIIETMIKKVKERYPNIYRVLVEERNEIMALNLKTIMQQNHDKKILAIIGAGHEKDIIELMKKDKVSISYSFTVV